MTLGVFAKTFVRHSVEEVFAAITRHGIRHIQFNFSVCGLDTIPVSVPEPILQEVASGLSRHHLHCSALSATFNLAHPDPSHVASILKRMPDLIRAAQVLNCPMLTLCSGTRDPHDMWRDHPGNATPEAWRDMTSGIHALLKLTESSRLKLGIEPETANIIRSAHHARRLLEEIGSPRLRIILDPANLLLPGDLPRQQDIIREAVGLLHGTIGLAHAKELSDPLTPDNRAPGSGVIDWPFYLEALRHAGYAGPLILHGLREADLAGSMAYLSPLLHSTEPS